MLVSISFIATWVVFLGLTLSILRAKGEVISKGLPHEDTESLVQSVEKRWAPWIGLCLLVGSAVMFYLDLGFPNFLLAWVTFLAMFGLVGYLSQRWETPL